tara:strand:+ start:279 stop:635 length:357 start_codon:yes stop_codon:yes gene_type:complete
MALSSLDKDVATRLFQMISKNDDCLDSIKQDHSAYGKLELIFSQIQFLQQQARQIIDHAEVNKFLNTIKEKKIVGCTYYLYTQNGKKILSIISPSEWTTFEEYNGAYLYDYDHSFKEI